MHAIKHFLIINTPTDKVFKAITEINQLKEWWTENTFYDEAGDKIINFIFNDKDHNKMKILTISSNKLVEWDCIKGDPEWLGTKLRFSLEPKDKKTILRFKHYNWQKETDFFAHCNYHWGYYMRSLKLYCESGEGTPFRAKTK